MMTHTRLVVEKERDASNEEKIARMDKGAKCVFGY